MSLVGFRAMLVHTCDVLRQASGSASAHGHNTGSFSTHIDDMPCRFMENTGQELLDPEYVNVKTWRVFCESGQGITFEDRLSYGGQTYEILDVVSDVAGASEITRITAKLVTA